MVGKHSQCHIKTININNCRIPSLEYNTPTKEPHYIHPAASEVIGAELVSFILIYYLSLTKALHQASLYSRSASVGMKYPPQ